MSCSDVAKVTGEHLLFLGTSSINWSVQQFQQAAQFAKAHGIDSLIVKCADGTYQWYGGLSGYQAIKKAIQAEGVGCIPYTYSYGNKYNALDTEIDILISYMQDSGVVCMDAETEWNGQVGWAQHMCSRMQGQSGVFLVSTWSDPSLQNWQGVLQALNPCVSAYLPQQYNNSLAGYWQEFGASGASCLQPTLDMTQDFGSNDPVSIAKAAHDQGHTAISVWYYETAVANPGLLDQIFAAFPKTTITEEEQPMSIDITNPIVAGYFKASTDGKTWQCKNGYVIGGAILDFYKSFGGKALCGLSWLGLPLINELGISGHPGVTCQRFERGVLVFDPSRVNDSPPGLDTKEQVYVAHIDSGPGQDPRVEDLQDQVLALKTMPATANLQQINNLVAQASTAIAQAGTAIAKIGPLSQVQ
jgi:hypothetical protein